MNTTARRRRAVAERSGITIAGETMTASAWCRRLGLSRRTYEARRAAGLPATMALLLSVTGAPLPVVPPPRPIAFRRVTPADPPTAAQCRILEGIVALHKRLGYAPSIRELAAWCGTSSTNAIASHLRLLRDRQLVAWSPAAARTLVVTAAGARYAEGQQ